MELGTAKILNYTDVFLIFLRTFFIFEKNFNDPFFPFAQPLHTFIKTVTFDLRQGETAGSRVTKATLVSSPVPAYNIVEGCGEGVLTLPSSSSITSSVLNVASTRYAIKIAGKDTKANDDNDALGLMVHGSSPLFDIAPYLSITLPSVAKSSVTGGDAIKVTWKAYNIAGKICVFFFFC